MKRNSGKRKRLVIGVTGGIASGKTAVSREFNHLGAALIEADEVSRDVVKPGRTSWKKIVRRFGKEILKPDRTLDRGKLAEIVFCDSEKRRMLEEITHPAIIAEMRRRLRAQEKAGESRIVVVDIPLLYEVGLEDTFDVVVVVWVPEGVQRERLRRRDALTRAKADERIKTQWPLSVKKKLADYVVDNSKEWGQVKAQVKKIWGVLTKNI